MKRKVSERVVLIEGWFLIRVVTFIRLHCICRQKYFDVLDSFFISVLCDFEGFIFWGDISFGPLLQSNNSLVVLKFIDLRTDWLGLYAQNHFSS